MRKILLFITIVFTCLIQSSTFAFGKTDYKLTNYEKNQIKQIASKYRDDDFIKNIISDYIKLKLEKGEK
jgi:hypothetical protein